jgi:hypothetical protein
VERKLSGNGLHNRFTIDMAAAYGTPFKPMPPPQANGSGITSYTVTVNQSFDNLC